ncbi:MAG: WecB/TagA/CpsF family glycosyltransferase [Lachnospiraceae bacterium]|jgi:exopolysaccharide biosynthesis WecB/TagA/CpsF family protein|nr:WecB/TagA/CpsF family glycosyltransferase [Lachnospiraceae bacterium]
MDKYNKRKKRRHAVEINAAAYLASFLTALLIRFGGDIETWQVQLYTSIFISALLLAAALHFYRVSTKRYKYVEEMDPLETLSYVIRNQILLFLAMVVYLFATQQAERVSRVVIVLFPLLNVCYEYVLRLLYRRRILRKEANLPVDRTVAVITYKKYIETIENTLKKSLPSNVAVEGSYVWEEKLTWQEKLNAVPPLKEVYLYLPDLGRVEEWKLVRELEEKGFVVQVILSCFGNILTEDMIGKESAYQTVYVDNLRYRADVLGIHYTVSSPDKAAMYVKMHLEELKGKYICFSNVHTTVTAYRDPTYLAVQNGSAFTFPDGSPIAKEQIRLGYNNAKRVAGPDFMEAMFRFTQNTGIRHYFYGSTQETLDLLTKNLQKQYPGLQIAGIYSPPFRDLTQDENREILDMMRSAKADIYWIGLGAPKQEIWMANHRDQLPGVMVGVGAGFNFYAGNIKRAPKWMQKAGLEWLYRLTQDPKRLLKRYFFTNIEFTWLIVTHSKRYQAHEHGTKDQ